MTDPSLFDELGDRQCCRCGEIKPLEEFSAGRRADGRASLKTVGGNKTQTITKVFDPTAYEWLFVLCGDATAYLIPTTAITARYSIFLGRRYERFRLED
jgi:hypothetical protein